MWTETKIFCYIILLFLLKPSSQSYSSICSTETTLTKVEKSSLLLAYEINAVGPIMVIKVCSLKIFILLLCLMLNKKVLVDQCLHPVRCVCFINWNKISEEYFLSDIQWDENVVHHLLVSVHNGKIQLMNPYRIKLLTLPSTHQMFQRPLKGWFCFYYIFLNKRVEEDFFTLWDWKDI